MVGGFYRNCTNDGTLKIKNGGLKEKIVEGHQFAKTGRKKYFWPAQMKRRHYFIRSSLVRNI
jgi:hypothetical protein